MTEPEFPGVLSRKRSRRPLRFACCGCGVGIFTVLAALLLLMDSFIHTNRVDNTLSDPATKASMIRCTREWARLAPFPASAADFHIQTAGNAFTRRFNARFSAPGPDIELWLRDSAGTAEAGPRRLYRLPAPHEHLFPFADEPPQPLLYYEIKPGGGANTAAVGVDLRTSEVVVMVAWS